MNTAQERSPDQASDALTAYLQRRIAEIAQQPARTAETRAARQAAIDELARELPH